jgi:hypothetical protein
VMEIRYADSVLTLMLSRAIEAHFSRRFR